MKISILEGVLLDYWVAMAAGYEPVYQPDSVEGPRVCINRYHDHGDLVSVPLWTFSPSTSWAQAGPIIEREQIDLVCDFGRWMAMHSKHTHYGPRSESPLVAAMRAYLMWEYGDEVPVVQRHS